MWPIQNVFTCTQYSAGKPVCLGTQNLWWEKRGFGIHCGWDHQVVSIEPTSHWLFCCSLLDCHWANSHSNWQCAGPPLVSDSSSPIAAWNSNGEARGGKLDEKVRDENERVPTVPKYKKVEEKQQWMKGIYCKVKWQKIQRISAYLNQKCSFFHLKIRLFKHHCLAFNRSREFKSILKETHIMGHDVLELLSFPYTRGISSVFLHFSTFWQVNGSGTNMQLTSLFQKNGGHVCLRQLMLC